MTSTNLHQQIITSTNPITETTSANYTKKVLILKITVNKTTATTKKLEKSQTCTTCSQNSKRLGNTDVSSCFHLNPQVKA